MSIHDYPSDPDEWSEETINRLVDEGRREDSRIEFKSRFRESRGYSNRNEDIRKETVAFANNSGGHIVFGIVDNDDDAAERIGDVEEFSSDENPRRTISNILQNIEPSIEFAVNSFNIGNKGVVVVYVEEALRPPVTTPGEGTYYRHTENSIPMTLDQMRGMLTEFSERETAIRQLEKEVQFFFDMCEGYNFTPDGSSRPYFEAVNVSGLKEAIRGKHGLWQDERVRGKLRSINSQLVSIEMAENDWEQFAGSDHTPRPNIGPLSSSEESKSRSEEYAERLESPVRRLWELCKQLVEVCDLDVEVKSPPSRG